MQGYLKYGDISSDSAAYIFLCRSKMLDLKANFKGKYSQENLYCEGCLQSDTHETQEHIFRCDKLSSGEVVVDTQTYEDLLGDDVLKQIKISEILKSRLQKRSQIINKRISPVPQTGAK